MTQLAGSTVLVTGANGGLGTQFVSQAVDAGAARVYAGARAPRQWDDDRIVPLLLDVDDRESIAAAARLAADTTILVNNAGIARPGDLLSSPIEAIEAQLTTNLLGPLLMCRALADSLVEGHGAVINVASVLSWLPTGKGYSISKAALWSATNGLRLELAPRGVQVLGAYLGYTDTPMTRGLDLAVLNDPAEVVRAIYAGLEDGAAEVLVDETTRQVRAALSAPLG